MREVNYYPPLEGSDPSHVLFGVARGLEDLFPVPDHPRFQDIEEAATPVATLDADEACQSG